MLPCCCWRDARCISRIGTFIEGGTFSLELSSTVIASGLLTGLLLGVLGAVPAAIRCLGAPLPKTFRS